MKKECNPALKKAEKTDSTPDPRMEVSTKFDELGYQIAVKYNDAWPSTVRGKAVEAVIPLNLSVKSGRKSVIVSSAIIVPEKVQFKPISAECPDSALDKIRLFSVKYPIV